MNREQLATLGRCCLQERIDSIQDASVEFFRLITTSFNQVDVESARLDLFNQVHTVKRCDHGMRLDMVEQEVSDMITTEGPTS